MTHRFIVLCTSKTRRDDISLDNRTCWWLQWLSNMVKRHPKDLTSLEVLRQYLLLIICVCSLFKHPKHPTCKDKIKVVWNISVLGLIRLLFKRNWHSFYSKTNIVYKRRVLLFLKYVHHKQTCKIIKYAALLRLTMKISKHI